MLPRLLLLLFSLGGASLSTNLSAALVLELKPLDADAAGCRAGPLRRTRRTELDLVGLLVAPEGGGGDEDG